MSITDVFSSTGPGPLARHTTTAREVGPKPSVRATQPITTALRDHVETIGAQRTVGHPSPIAAKATSPFLAIARAHRCPEDFSPAVLRNIEAIRADPHTFTGTDLTHLPFVTIDYEQSKDLDQALYIEKHTRGSYTVHYAIADASYFVRPGTALDQEARKRGETTYLPDTDIPMLPHALSEELCSLNPGVRRRAFVVSVTLNAKGDITDTSMQRGIILSRAKLTYSGVQAYIDQLNHTDLGSDTDTDAKSSHQTMPTQVPTLHQRPKHPYADTDYGPSLMLLRDVGVLRCAISKDRGVVQFGDGDVRINTHHQDGRQSPVISMEQRALNDVEQWNAQISLLVNHVVSKTMDDAGLIGLHRVHPAPSPTDLEGFRAQTVALGIPWERHILLQDYLETLPITDARTEVIKTAACRLNAGAKYQTAPGLHYGLQLHHYAHFTAPMRRYQDIVVHRILAAWIEHGERIPYQHPVRHADQAQDQEPTTEDLTAVVRAVQAAKVRNAHVQRDCLAYASEHVLKKHYFERMQGRITRFGRGHMEVRIPEAPYVLTLSTGTLNAQANGKAVHHMIDAGTTLTGPYGQFRLADTLEVIPIPAPPKMHNRVQIMPAVLMTPASHRSRTLPPADRRLRRHLSESALLGALAPAKALGRAHEI